MNTLTFSFFFSLIIAVNFAQFMPISCNSTTSGFITANETFDRFSLYLGVDSYVEISTCGSSFNTFLVLVNGSYDVVAYNDDDFNPGPDGCGINAVIDDGPFEAGDYHIAISEGGFGANTSYSFSYYQLAVECSSVGIPKVPDAVGIPVESDCPFVEAGPIFPLDVCSLRFSSDSLGFSRKYVCNPARDGVILYDYQTGDCSGVGTGTALNGEGMTYYFNCYGSSDNCDIGAYGADCEYGQSTVHVVTDLCAGKRMFTCDGTMALETFYDSECQSMMNVSYLPEFDDECTYWSDCGAIFPETTVGECECEIGFECVSWECVRDCDLLAIDEYLLQCSVEYGQTGAVIQGLQTSVAALEAGLQTANARIGAVGVQSNNGQNSAVVPLFSFSDGAKDAMIMALFMVNLLVVFYLCYEKRAKSRSYVSLKEYPVEEEERLNE